MVEPSRVCLLDDVVVSLVEARVRSFVSDELLFTELEGAWVALYERGGGMERGRCFALALALLTERGMAAAGVGGGGGGSGWVVLVCEIGRSNSCPPIIPPYDGETCGCAATTPFSGTCVSVAPSAVGYPDIDDKIRTVRAQALRLVVEDGVLE